MPLFWEVLLLLLLQVANRDYTLQHKVHIYLEYHSVCLFPSSETVIPPSPLPPASVSVAPQSWANLDQTPNDLDKTIFRDLSPTPIP